MTTGDVKYGLKIIEMQYCASRMILYKVFMKGTPLRKTGDDMITYLNSLPSTSTANYVTVTDKQLNQLKFNKTQKKMVTNVPMGKSLTSLFWLTV